ncbi:ADP-ribosylation/crystallin J1 [Ruegeria lacuscaerulensis]|uniref:ADP-ribosylation/crystallin J1 n=1 Tax=Ruegeria lacuscaerulensis TaxID=55218 RepID=UPI00147AD7C5|nr:ADP-ribosylation/crystallin J1 [Ruegeria lacuscaerulensis]
MILFRPTGAKELELVKESGWKVWPPRLADQPIFYPVTTFEYAEKIARDWNSVLPAPDNCGFVTKFEITHEAEKKYTVQDAGGKAHTELWIPADDLTWFNGQILGKICVVAGYRNGHAVTLSDHPLTLGFA